MRVFYLPHFFLIKKRTLRRTCSSQRVFDEIDERPREVPQGCKSSRLHQELHKEVDALHDLSCMHLRRRKPLERLNAVNHGLHSLWCEAFVVLQDLDDPNALCQQPAGGRIAQKRRNLRYLHDFLRMNTWKRRAALIKGSSFNSKSSNQFRGLIIRVSP